MKKPGKIEVTTPSDREVRVTREFDAPRELVFEAWTKPDLVMQWLYGPDDWPFESCEMDLRVGGRLRWVWRHTTDGARMGLTGVFREIVPPERIVHTEIFDEDWTGGETLATTTFVERKGKTLMTITVLYSSKEARDAAMRTGMTEGMAQSYDRLDAVLSGRA